MCRMSCQMVSLMRHIEPDGRTIGSQERLGQTCGRSASIETSFGGSLDRLRHPSPKRLLVGMWRGTPLHEWPLSLGGPSRCWKAPLFWVSAPSEDLNGNTRSSESSFVLF